MLLLYLEKHQKLHNKVAGYTVTMNNVEKQMFSLEPVFWNYYSRITHFSLFAPAIKIVIVVSFPASLFRDTQGRTQAQFKRVPRGLHNYIVITINDNSLPTAREGNVFRSVCQSFCLQKGGLHPGWGGSAFEGSASRERVCIWGVCIQEDLHPGGWGGDWADPPGSASRGTGLGRSP